MPREPTQAVDGGLPDEETPLLTESSVANVNGSDRARNDEVTKEPSNLELATIMSSVWVGRFLAALDGTVFATLAAPISGSFASFSVFSWLATSYLIATSAFQPLAGKLTDIFSRRSGLLFSYLFFGVGTLMCGLANGPGMIIIGRVVAGIGGGGLTAISTFIASDLIPLRRRGIWQGIGNICWGSGSALGGIYGGWIDDIWGWRWAFLLQIPPVIVSAVLVYFKVNIPVQNSGKASIKRVDFLGAFTLVSALVLLLFGLNAGGNTVPWSHPLILTTLPLSIVLVGVFIYVEEKIAAEPIIPVRLLLNRAVAVSCVVNWLNNMAVFALIFYTPLYCQAIMDLTPVQSGLRLIPQSLGTAVGSLGAGIIMRSTGKYYWLNVSIGVVFVMSYLTMCTLDLTSPAWIPFFALSLSGIGYGSSLTVNLTAMIAAVDHSHQAVVTSASYAFRATGSAIGITAASTIFQNVLRTQLWARLGDLPGAIEIISKLRNNVEELRNLESPWKEAARESYVAAVRNVFIFSLGLSLVSFCCTLLMREHKLHSTLARGNSATGRTSA